MRVPAGLLLCTAAVGVVSLVTIEPRLHYDFPSMIDDWSAIARAPDQLHEVLRLGSPEELRYRPGFVLWNALQWHTFGAPGDFAAPQVWGVLRWLVVVAGLTLLAALIVSSSRGGGRRIDYRWVLLVVGAALIVVTPPSIAVDLARYGPQEPLLVGCMSLGAVLLVRSLDVLLEPVVRVWVGLAAGAAGLVLWAFGVLQKETSLCVLLLAPFLVPLALRQRERWSRAGSNRRVAIGVVAAGMVAPFVPMLVRALQLRLADERVYEDTASAKGFTTRLSDQLSLAGDVLHTPLPMIVLAAAVVALALRGVRVGIDWLATGLLVVALAFLLAAADTGVVTSRYLIPSIALGALALARTAGSLDAATATTVGALLATGALWQASEARGWVESWVDVEQARETLVREAAGRAAGGCHVGVVGLNAELVAALPVLMPLAKEPARDCLPGERFVAVIDPGGPGTETPPDDPVLAACAPAEQPVWSSDVAKIVRCTAAA